MKKRKNKGVLWARTEDRGRIRVREYYAMELVEVKEGDDISNLGPGFAPPLKYKDHFFEKKADADRFIAKQKEGKA